MEQENYLFQSHALLSLKSAAVWGNVELRELADAMATFYPLVISANISKNSLYLMESEHFINSSLPTFGTIDSLFAATAEMLHPEDRGLFAKVASRAHLLSIYESGQDSLNLYCRAVDDNGAYHWVQVIIEMYKNSAGDICGFNFTRLSPEKEHEQQMGRLQKIMELAVESAFQYLCLLYPESGTYEVCASSKDVLCKIPQKGDYSAVIESVRDLYIAPKERGSYYESTRMAHVIEQMNLLGKYSFQYTLADGIREAAFYWCDKAHKEILMTVRRIK